MRRLYNRSSVISKQKLAFHRLTFLLNTSYSNRYSCSDLGWPLSFSRRIGFFGWNSHIASCATMLRMFSQVELSISSQWKPLLDSPCNTWAQAVCKGVRVSTTAHDYCKAVQLKYKILCRGICIFLFRLIVF